MLPLPHTISVDEALFIFGLEGCTCDLTGNGCDVNCCCDVVDCSEADQQAFTDCKDTDVKYGLTPETHKG